MLIGAGIPLFGELPGDIALEHVSTRQYASGLVQSEYEIAAASYTGNLGNHAQIR